MSHSGHSAKVFLHNNTFTKFMPVFGHKFLNLQMGNWFMLTLISHTTLNGMVYYSLTPHSTQYRSFQRRRLWAVMYISHSVMEGQRHNNPLNRVAFVFVYNGPKGMELAPIVEVAKAVGGSFKLVTPTPRTVREMTQLLRGVFLANHLASTDSSIRTTKRQNT